MTDRTQVAFADVVRRIGDGEFIHTLRSGAAMLLGADLSRGRLLALVKEHGCEESGPGASHMGHTLACDCGGSWLFIAAAPAELEKPCS